MKHETSVIDIFNEYMRLIAEKRKVPFHSFGLDGQDRRACGDNLFLSTDKFCIVEYKYTSNEIKNEKRKEKVKSVCLCLEYSEKMKSLHDKCHYIAFSNELFLMANIYRKEVCNKKVLGDIPELSSSNQLTGDRVGIKEFAQDFFTNKDMFLTLKEFEEYLNLLLSCEGKSSDDKSSDRERGLELVISNIEMGSVKIKKVNSLLEAQEWVIKNYNRRNNFKMGIDF
ncbi:hypothetical protein ACLIX2_08180 [Proteus cibi]